MVHNKRKRLILIASAIVVVLLASIATAVFIGSQSKEKDPYKYGETTNSPDETSSADNSEKEESTATKPPKDSADNETGSASTLDPATVGTIDIEPLAVRVSYVKGAGGFEYQILRTPNGTQYVEFRSPELIGTKCTDDTGAFASVLVSPQANESSTLAKTTTIGDTKYGLSLASSTCTSDADKLKTFQKSFSDAFTLLKKLD